MFRATAFLIILCLFVWAVGFFVYGLGVEIHLLLLAAVVIASIRVLRN
ncbi:lmo0937 family membrane protein [Tamlana sp. s12]|nr:lmo0937 family membrane protein [Tamlana sp. s12]QQY83601.1 lmo0937 family membrane protein [Tamlana sp. s12]